MQLSAVLFLLSAAVCSNFAHDIYYVKPSSSPQFCPGQPCLTLDQYAQQANTISATEVTFQLLSGNHSLRKTFIFTNRLNIILKGKHFVSIKLQQNGHFLSENVTNLIIERLTFILNFNSTIGSLSALEIFNSTGIFIFNCTFQGTGKLDEIGTRAVYSEFSTITITSCLFEGNTGDYGGAISSEYSNITLINSVFRGNKAKDYGGAVYAHQSMLVLIGNGTHELDNSRNRDTPFNLPAYYSTRIINLVKSVPPNPAALFADNEAGEGGAISLSDSNAIFSGYLLVFRNNLAERSGAIYINSSSTSDIYLVTNMEHLLFVGNRASEYNVGAIYVDGVTLVLGESLENNHYFFNNSLSSIYCNNYGELIIAGNSYFVDNGHSNYRFSSGGAISVDYGGTLLISGYVLFAFNAAVSGGALYLYNSDAVFLNGTAIEFINNSAVEGGGIYSLQSSLRIQAEQIRFISNVAQARGGAIAVINDDLSRAVEISGDFIDNRGMDCGGALYVEGETNITLADITVIGSSDSALCFSNAEALFTGITQIMNNTGKYGGGIKSQNSMLTFIDDTITEFEYNKAVVGGAIYLLYGTITFLDIQEDSTLFAYNTASTDGGALYAIGTDVTLWGPVSFASNTAINGGALYFKTATRLTLETDYVAQTLLYTKDNYASEYGGAMYVEEAATLVQCNSELYGVSVLVEAEDNQKIRELPYCFMQLKGEDIVFVTVLNSYLDSAGKGGAFLYGGLLDRCRMDVQVNQGDYQRASIIPYRFIQYTALDLDLPDTTVKGVSSRPYQLCFCESIDEYNCTEVEELRVHRGQRWQVFVVALDQLRSAVSTQVTALTSPSARLKLNQSPQLLDENCSSLTYNIYSQNTHEQLILYPDGPCHDNGLARAVISMKILPCPPAFAQSASGEECICEERLRAYETECVIDEGIYITKRGGSTFWIGSLNHSNGTYWGLVLCSTCPLEYCSNETINLTLDNLDLQCDHNHSGFLCGQCKAHHSLLLGSSKCQICSNTFLALLVPFAAAGVALVFFLSFLRLTVATGMINSIILYANIVQVNKNLFLSNDARNFLTVFIAWLNLDLGFETCFYYGMDAYAATWLQFTFPIYIWILISLIILASRYSITVSKIVGHNPVAVLATLLIMSYAKILKIIIEVYSIVDLDYPDNKTVTVWLKDANVPYLQSKHLILTVVTSLVLAFLFFPYTLLLLLGHKLYRFSGKRGFRWFNKIKPLLDSYYAPYKIHTRYWTGFLLLVRCALYIVFSVSSLRDKNKSLLAINITFTSLVIIAWLSVLIYKNFYVNIIEASVYLNLIILSAATSNEVNTPALVYTLEGIVFATTMGIIAYHFHLLYTAKSPVWLKVKAKLRELRVKASTKTELYQTNVPVNVASSFVTKTVIDLREPLLED